LNGKSSGNNSSGVRKLFALRLEIKGGENA